MDLAALRAELCAAGLPSDPSTVRLNAFPSGRRTFESELIDEVERIEGAPDRDARRAVRVDARRVPARIRAAVPLARRWGVPDDADRGRLVASATGADRRALRRILTPARRRAIDAWLDERLDGPEPPAEAVAFLYLLEAFEEMLGAGRESGA